MKKISQLRRKRLLLLAGKPANHKRFYHQYYHLINEGLVGWAIGFAYLTKKGEAELKALIAQ